MYVVVAVFAIFGGLGIFIFAVKSIKHSILMENTENISLPEANHDDVTSVNGSVASPDVPADNDAAALAELIDKHPLLAQLVADIASGKVDINDFDETLAIRYHRITDAELDAALAQCDFDDGRKTEIRRRADERRSSPQPFSAEELVKALSFDDACQRSEQRGYVKGRNERIDIEQLSPSFATADETEHRARYRQIFSAPRKSVWDD